MVRHRDSIEALGDGKLRKLAAARSLLQAIEGYIVEVMQGAGSREVPEWVDQYGSPLGRRGHLEAVRSGRLPGYKVGRRVLVRREDVDEYVKRFPVERKGAVTPGEEEGFEGCLGASDVALRALSELGLQLVGRH